MNFTDIVVGFSSKPGTVSLVWVNGGPPRSSSFQDKLQTLKGNIVKGPAKKESETQRSIAEMIYRMADVSPENHEADQLQEQQGFLSRLKSGKGSVTTVDAGTLKKASSCPGPPPDKVKPDRPHSTPSSGTDEQQSKKKLSLVVLQPDELQLGASSTPTPPVILPYRRPSSVKKPSSKRQSRRRRKRRGTPIKISFLEQPRCSMAVSQEKPQEPDQITLTVASFNNYS